MKAFWIRAFGPAYGARQRQSTQGKQSGGVYWINPVIGGLDSANSARLAPGPISGLIPGANPGKDMGTNSDFQKELETTQLARAQETPTMRATARQLDLRTLSNGSLTADPGANLTPKLKLAHGLRSPTT